MRPLALPETEAYAARYAGLRMRPLRIVLEIEVGSNLVSYDPLNLDNLLARRVLEEATGGWTAIVAADDEYVSIPVPLAVLWRDPDGLPLYAATPFATDGVAVDDVVYWHKRSQEGAFTATKRGGWSPKTDGNRYVERRIPTPVVVAESWTAECVGDAEEIARLIGAVGHVGKRRGGGHGVVRSWTIAASGAFSLVRDGRLTRNLPEAAAPLLGRAAIPEGLPSPLGWTPPQWRPALFRPGWRIGTPVHDVGGWG